MAIQQINENNVMVYFSDEISVELPVKIARVIDQIALWNDGTIIDLTPSYTSLLVSFNPLKISADKLIQKLKMIHTDDSNSNTSSQGRVIDIPVYYSIESGEDLEQTAQIIGISITELIHLHSEPEYTVFALGFLPGYAFMGVLDKRLRLPRLSTPRSAVPAGSVAIAEKQTAVYPSQTPGGWRLLGRSPMTLFDPNVTPPTPYKIADKVKFKPISRDEYFQLGGSL